MGGQLQKIEVKEKKKESILIYCQDNELLLLLLEHYSKNFQIIYISSSPLSLEKTTDATFIPTSSLSLLQRVKQIPEYALLVLSSDSDIRVFETLFKSLSSKKIKFLVLIQIGNYQNFLSALSTYKEEGSITFAFLGEVFSPKRSFNNSLSSFIDTTLSTKQFKMSGNDLSPIFPISDEDLLIGISSLLFSSAAKSKLSYLFYKHPQTILSAIHVLKRVEPDLQAIMENNENNLPTQTRDNIEQNIKKHLGYLPEYREEHMKGFEKSLISFSKKALENSQPKSQQVKRKAGSGVLKSRIFWTITGSISLCIIVTSVLGILLFKNLTTRAFDQLENGDLIALSKSISKIQTIIQISRPIVRSITTIADFFNIDDKLSAKVSLFEDGAEVGRILTNDAKIASKFGEGISESSLNSIFADWTFSYFELERLRSEGNLPFTFNSEYGKMLSLSPTIKSLLGYDGQKRYLLLFQNNHELRPTGGFIGSVGELVLENGKVITITIHDVYELDGQLKTHIDPHYIVGRYLQPHLYLRDSNFDISFEESAQKAAQIYKLESGKEVNGVIALNFDVLAKVIEKTGPIELPEFNTTITSENAFDVMQNTIESDFFPGSKDKRDILNAIFEQITNKLEKNPDLSFTLGTEIPKLILENNIMFAFSNQAMQKVYTINGFSPSYFDPRLKESGVYYDSLAINEANIGGNKANGSIKRSVSYEIDFRKDPSPSRLTIFLDNTQNTTDSYQAYIRIATPFKSRLTSIAIDSEKKQTVDAITDLDIINSKDFKRPSAFEIENTFLYNLQIFGFVTTVESGKTQTIQIDYINGMKAKLSGPIHYSLMYHKQPGIDEFPISSTVYFPQGYIPKNTRSRVYGKDFITLDTNINQSTELFINLTKDVE